jgi:hypothetical protein
MSEKPLTVGDAMRASHPSAGVVLDDTKNLLDRIAAIVQSDRCGKPGAIDAITDALQKYGYTFV